MKKLLLMISILAISMGAFAQDGKWKIRLRMTSIDPVDSSTTIAGTDVLEDGTIVPETYIDVSSNIVPELDITYMLSDHWGLELILATSKHDLIGVDGSLAGADLGKADLLPPTLTAQYFFNPDGDVKFYMGAGLNYTLISYDLSSDLAAIGVTDVDFDSSVGYAINAGFDGYITDNWLVNIDMKYISISTEAEIQTATGTLDTVEIDLNPWVVSIGIGYHF